MQTSERHRGRSMASHRSLLPALLLLAVITGDASSTMLEDNREPYLEPADEAGYRTYIVLLQPPKVDMDADAHKAWHKSFLPSLKTSLGEPRLRQSWHTLVHGFSARLTDAEVVWVSFKPGFLRAFPNVIEYQQTTRTPAFLGLSYHMGESPSDWRSIGNGGLGMIIGIVDGGIANSHPSMEDGGFEDTEPPQKWTGSCHSGIKCNKKLIGAQNFVGTGPPLDNANGHGTQVASIAAGNFVTGANFRGLATGTSSGMAPLAHVAVYKACREDGECTHESVVSAITAAVDDSVDVISVSFGGKFPGTYDHNPVAVAAFNAMRSGILVVAAAGNDGPAASTICNDVPWLLTVGSGTVDRSLMVNVITDDEHGTIVFGQSLADRRWLTDDRAMHDLLYDAGHDNCDYPEDELPVRVPGRVVVCQAGYFSSRTLDILLSHNASGIVMVDPEVIGYTGELFDMGNRPIAQVPYQDGGYLKSYSSSRHPRASCDFTAGTVVDDTVLAPMVAYSSSRGPSRYPILKPDVLAPGVNILAAMPGGGFGIVTGTSMAAPHVAGAAILLKKLYPRWSPAAIRSALTTTADIVDNSRQPIVDEKRYAANLYMMGAGHVNVVRAMDPGLVYDIDERQYASYICATLGEAALEVMITGWSCSDLAFPHPSRINYPSFTLPLQPGGFTVRRVLTNVYVAPEPGTPEMYTVKVVMEAPQVRLTVDPSTFIVTYAGQVARFEVSVSQNSEFPSSPGNAYFGSIEWSSSQHKVRSPVVVVDGLVTSQAPAPLKLD